MSEQSKGLYSLIGCRSVEEVQRKLNFILGQISNRLDQLEGLRGYPTFYKTLFRMPRLTAGQVLRAKSSTEAEMDSIDVTDVTNAAPTIPSGTSAQIDVERSLISLVDAENDYVIHQFPTQWLEYNCEVFMFTTNEKFEDIDGIDNQIARDHQIAEDAVDGIIQGDGTGNYSAVTEISGDILIKIYDDNSTVIHEYPLEWLAYNTEIHGFYIDPSIYN